MQKLYWKIKLKIKLKRFIIIIIISLFRKKSFRNFKNFKKRLRLKLKKYEDNKKKCEEN